MFHLHVGGAAKRGPASVTFKGNVKGHESEFRWDVNKRHYFDKTCDAVTVDGNLATIPTNTRYRDVFDIADATGSPSTQKAQNPFTYLDQLSSEGTTLPPIFTLK